MNRPPTGHKGTFGHALLISGQWGMAGASILAAESCLRSGLGKLTVHIPVDNNDILQIAVPEAIVHHDLDPKHWTTPIDIIEGYQAIGIGPGIGTHIETAEALLRQLTFLKDSSVPLVLDADALNILAKHPEAIATLPHNTIITPHPGEYGRLKDATGLIPMEMAKQHHLIVVLKGHPTQIYYPDGQIVECPHGNDGMATAGSGDVLTGIILGLLAQGYSLSDAARIGVFLHAIAGDLAADALGHHAMIARDIIKYLPQAFKTALPTLSS